MKLTSPNGVRLSVSDEKGEALLKRGYKRLGAFEEAAPPAPAPKTPRRRKAATSEES